MKRELQRATLQKASKRKGNRKKKGKGKREKLRIPQRCCNSDCRYATGSQNSTRQTNGRTCGKLGCGMAAGSIISRLYILIVAAGECVGEINAPQVVEWV